MMNKFMSNIPCECGNPDSRWRGDRIGLRVRLCDKCANNEFYIQTITVRGEGTHHWVEGRSQGPVTDWISLTSAKRILRELIEG